MTPLRWILLLLAAGASALFANWIYTRREFPVGLRRVLALLRTLVFVLIVLLLLNPRLPLPSGDPPVWVLLDASGSMGRPLPGASGVRLWDEGLEQALRAGGDGERVLLFGSRVRGLYDRPSGTEGGASADELPASAPLFPADTSSLLAPALARAAELGATRVVLVSDLRFEDPGEGVRVLSEAGVSVEVAQLPSSGPEGGILRLDGDTLVAPGDSFDVAVTHFGEEADSGRLSIQFAEGASVTREVALAAPGRTRTEVIRLAAPPDTGSYTVLAEMEVRGDDFPSDDRDSLRVRVGLPRAGVVLLSLRPSWEGRTLLPVLSRATGLPGRGLTALSDGRFLGWGAGEVETGPVGLQEALRVLVGAELLILEGPGGPEWRELEERLPPAPPRVVLIGSQEAASAYGLSVGRPQEGEWYASSNLPSSPLAGLLAGMGVAGLPPLSAPLPPSESGAAGVSALNLQRAGAGQGTPALVLREIPGREGAPGRREVIALASDFWRWDAREGAPRRSYRTLWSAAAGWLLAGEGSDTGARDAEARGPGGPPPDAPLADDFEAGARAVPRDLRHPVMDRTLLAGAARSDAPPSVTGRPLRHFPLPYLLVIALLCAEWILRRREGLR